ncbi:MULTISPECIES: hypothetical protein [Klebsiella]|nr:MULTISPECIES: hypothetical protein [Klebsiella]HDG7854724.1 hypothetical protein [Klebsiella quasipneumoniae]ELI7105499.1 hypothetical protein [Klebsiella pneumoniae]MBO3721415.1 hypothetical protein [Klebsiella pneumoniae]HBW8316249.1 hypothetical protein [Klebsiella pneumoniae]HBW8624631.1 hypothetical protein [Klebsiella pneumoniae]
MLKSELLEIIATFINGMQGSEAEENLYNLRCYHYSLGSGESKVTGLGCH